MEPETSKGSTSGEQTQDVTDKAAEKVAQASKLFQTGVLLINGKRKNIDKAIKCIQRAITLIDSDYRYWQFLGEAYYHRGSLNPAINCFMKSLQLVENETSQVDDKIKQADCTYSRLRMSDIRLSVGHLDEALRGYEDIISVEPENVAALIGLAKTRLQLARNNFSMGLIKVGHHDCMEALKFSLRAIKLCPHLCITWKLGADCCLIQFVYAQRGQFRVEINENFPDDRGSTLYIDRGTCIELAKQFLCRALSIEPFQESGCLWHNLGISLYLKSTLIRDPVECKELLTRSMKCLLSALDYDRANSQIRNSIGVVAFNLNLLNTAQNFLIKSIQTNMSTSEIQFSNLGYIYLQKGEYRLASVAFSRSQAEEPLYFRSWLGNALLNHENNIDNLVYLRHCNRLENNYESQLLYSTKVSTLPLNEEYSRDIMNALDCMKRVINYDIHSLTANNTLGLLCEKSNYKDQALYYFTLAHNISHQDSRVIFNRLRQLRPSQSCVDCESARDGEFVKNAEKLVGGGNREYMLNFIYYLFNNQDYKQVNAKMTRFLDKLPQSDIESKVGAQILLGLAAKVQNQDFKSWFFKNIIDLGNHNCKETIVNLQCLLLLGALSKDVQLVEQISSDLSSNLLSFISKQKSQFISLFYSPDGYWIRMSIFSLIFCNNPNNRTKTIRLMLALFPTVPELWLFKGLVLLFRDEKQSIAAMCIKKASLIGTASADLGVVCDILLAILSNLEVTDLEPRTKYLSRALYKFPDINLLWVSLLSSLKVQKSSATKTMLLNEQDSNLFHIAINLIIKMIS